MLDIERQSRILKLLQAQGRVEVSALISLLKVSPATVRRDLVELERTGAIIRTHGGAIARDSLSANFPFITKPSHHAHEWQRIAQHACSWIQAGDTVILDADPMALEIARQLHGRHPLTVVTHDLEVARELADEPAITLYVAGGQVQRQFHRTGGIQAVEYYGRCRARKAFVVAEAFSLEAGVAAQTADRAAIQAAIAGCSEQVVVVANGGSIGETALFRAFYTAQVSLVITNQGADATILAELKQAGVVVEMV